MNSQISEHIQKLSSFGVRLRDSWIDSIKSQFFQSFDDLLKAFLFTDIEQTTEPDSFLLENLENPKYCITKPITVQIDEIIDTSLSDKDHLHKHQSQYPTLKALVNSGGFKIAGVIQDRIPNLDLDSEPGIKIMIKSGTYLIYGVLMICDDNIFVLGGNSPQLIEKKNQMLLSQHKNRSFQNIEELYDVIPDIQFGINADYIFQDFSVKRNAKNSKVHLQTPLKMESRINPIKEEPKIQSDPLPKHSITLESKFNNNTNMPTFRPTRQVKPPSNSRNQLIEKVSPQNPVPSFLSKSNQPINTNIIPKYNQPINPNITPKLNQPINPNITPKLNQPSNPSSTLNLPVIELMRLFDMARSKNETIYNVNAHVKSLNVNNDSSLSKEKRKLAPFIVTLESNINRQKIDISIDPYFLQQLFNLDYIDNLSPDDLIGTARVCEKKIKEMLSSPLSIIDKGRGKSTDRFLLTKY